MALRIIDPYTGSIFGQEKAKRMRSQRKSFFINGIDQEEGEGDGKRGDRILRRPILLLICVISPIFVYFNCRPLINIDLIIKRNKQKIGKHGRG